MSGDADHSEPVFCGWTICTTPSAANRAPAAEASLPASELEMLTRGLSNAEIGERLYLSEATVKTHVTRVLQKLGVRDRVRAVVLAYESGLVEPGSDELARERR